MFDMFVQSRTPFRDVQSGKLVRNPSKIFFKYLSGWFFIDLISVIPFELLGLLASDESSVGSLGVLRVLRLMKLAKLLRIFRASRKLKQIQVYINLRYATMQLVKVIFEISRNATVINDNIQYLVIVTFLMHWLACGFRIAADKSDPNDQAGWVDHFAEVRKINVTSLGMAEVYLMALYMSSGSIALIGYGWSVAQPSSTREFVYSTFVNFVSYFLAVYFIANLSDTLAQATRTKTQQDIIVDNYLAIFDRLKLDMRLKVKVNEYLGSHFAQTLQAKEASMMRDLPVALHGFISMEVFIEFVMSIPFLVPFIEREPVLTQTICRGIEIRTFSANSLLFNEGFEGVYYLEHGIVSLEGKLFVRWELPFVIEAIANSNCKLQWRYFWIDNFARQSKKERGPVLDECRRSYPPAEGLDGRS